MSGTRRAVAFPPGVATGLGSLPGTDIAEAVRVVLGELPDLPYLPELPARGPGADLIGRSAGFLVDLPVQLYAGQWRLSSRAGRDTRRIADLLERDLDQLTEQTDGYAGPLKISSAGPWTLAAGLAPASGGPLLRDAGAVRELTASLAEGLSAHVREVSRRVPDARVVLQLDEPSLPAVLAGRVPTESGFGTLRAVPEPDAVVSLGTVVEAVAGAQPDLPDGQRVPVVVHCCAPDPPVALARAAGAAAVAVDLAQLTDLDAVGEAVDAGTVLFAGAVPATGVPPAPAGVAGTVRDLWRKLGFALPDLPHRVVVTPACGLAGATPQAARAIMAACREAATRLYHEARS